MKTCLEESNTARALDIYTYYITFAIFLTPHDFDRFLIFYVIMQRNSLNNIEFTQ